MTTIDKNILNTCSSLFEGLSSYNKLELIEILKKSIKKDHNNREKNFFNSFGSFASDKSPEDIITDIKVSRKFRAKQFKL